MNTFITNLQRAWQQQDSLLCVGLDPDPRRMPAHIARTAAGMQQFCQRIVDATAPFVCAFKPQFAHFAAYAAETALQQTIAYIKCHYAGIPVILDAKRGDIGSTAEFYAKEAFERYDADAVTVNPYLGGDALAPYLRYAARGVIVVCCTSNPGSSEFQQLTCDGLSIAEHVAQHAHRHWNAHGNVALVVAATQVEQLARIRGLVGDLPLLVPGVGSQGGDVKAVLEQGLDSQRRGLIISASRSVIFAGRGPQYAQQAADAARTLRDTINQFRYAPAMARPAAATRAALQSPS